MKLYIKPNTSIHQLTTNWKKVFKFWNLRWKLAVKLKIVCCIKESFLTDELQKKLDNLTHNILLTIKIKKGAAGVIGVNFQFITCRCKLLIIYKKYSQCSAYRDALLLGRKNVGV